MNSTEKILKSSSILVIGGLFGKSLGILNQALLGRLLGPSDFGNLAIILTIIEITTIIILVGTKTGFVNFISGYVGKNDKIGLSGIIIQGGFFNIIMGVSTAFIAFFLLNHFLNNKFSETEILLIALIIPFYAFYPLMEAVLQGFGNTKYKVLGEEIIKKIIRIVLFIVLFYYVSLRLEGALIALLVATMLVILYILIIIERKFVPFRSLLKYNKRNEIKGLLKYSWPLAFSAYLLLVFNYMDIISLTYFKDSSDVGFYKAAMGISALVGILPHSLTYMFFPMVSKLVKTKNKEEVKNIFSSTVKFAFSFSLVGMFIILVNNNLFINIIYGNTYLESANILILLGFAQFIVYATGPTGSMLNSLGKTKQTMFCNITGGILNLILNIPFVILWGTIGVAISTSISVISRNLLTLYFIKRNLKFLPFTYKYFLI